MFTLQIKQMESAQQSSSPETGNVLSNEPTSKNSLNSNLLEEIKALENKIELMEEQRRENLLQLKVVQEQRYVNKPLTMISDFFGGLKDLLYNLNSSVNFDHSYKNYTLQTADPFYFEGELSSKFKWSLLKGPTGFQDFYEKVQKVIEHYFSPNSEITSRQAAVDTHQTYELIFPNNPGRINQTDLRTISLGNATQLLEYLMVNTIFQIDLLYAIAWTLFGINQIQCPDAAYYCFFMYICVGIIIIATLVHGKLKFFRGQILNTVVLINVSSIILLQQVLTADCSMVLFSEIRATFLRKHDTISSTAQKRQVQFLGSLVAIIVNHITHHGIISYNEVTVFQYSDSIFKLIHIMLNLRANFSPNEFGFQIFLIVSLQIFSNNLQSAAFYMYTFLSRYSRAVKESQRIKDFFMASLKDQFIQLQSQVDSQTCFHLKAIAQNLSCFDQINRHQLLETDSVCLLKKTDGTVKIESLTKDLLLNENLSKVDVLELVKNAVNNRLYQTTSEQGISVFALEQDFKIPELILNPDVVSMLISNVIGCTIQTLKTKSFSIYVSWQPKNSCNQNQTHSMMVDPIFFKSDSCTSIISSPAKRIIATYGDKLQINQEKAIREAIQAQNSDAESVAYEPILRHSQLDPYNFSNQTQTKYSNCSLAVLDPVKKLSLDSTISAIFSNTGQKQPVNLANNGKFVISSRISSKSTSMQKLQRGQAAEEVIMRRSDDNFQHLLMQSGFLSVIDDHLDADLFDPTIPNSSFITITKTNSEIKKNESLHYLDSLQINKPNNGSNDLPKGFSAGSIKSIGSFNRNSSKNQLSMVSEKSVQEENSNNRSDSQSSESKQNSSRRLSIAPQLSIQRSQSQESQQWKQKRVLQRQIIKQLKNNPTVGNRFANRIVNSKRSSRQLLAIKQKKIVVQKKAKKIEDLGSLIDLQKLFQMVEEAKRNNDAPVEEILLGLTSQLNQSQRHSIGRTLLQLLDPSRKIQDPLNGSLKLPSISNPSNPNENSVSNSSEEFSIPSEGFVDKFTGENFDFLNDDANAHLRMTKQPVAICFPEEIQNPGASNRLSSQELDGFNIAFLQNAGQSGGSPFIQEQFSEDSPASETEPINLQLVNPITNSNVSSGCLPEPVLPEEEEKVANPSSKRQQKSNQQLSKFAQIMPLSENNLQESSSGEEDLSIQLQPNVFFSNERDSSDSDSIDYKQKNILAIQKLKMDADDRQASRDSFSSYNKSLFGITNVNQSQNNSEGKIDPEMQLVSVGDIDNSKVGKSCFNQNYTFSKQIDGSIGSDAPNEFCDNKKDQKKRPNSKKSSQSEKKPLEIVSELIPVQRKISRSKSITFQENQSVKQYLMRQRMGSCQRQSSLGSQKSNQSKYFQTVQSSESESIKSIPSHFGNHPNNQDIQKDMDKKAINRTRSKSMTPCSQQIIQHYGPGKSHFHKMAQDRSIATSLKQKQYSVGQSNRKKSSELVLSSNISGSLYRGSGTDLTYSQIDRNLIQLQTIRQQQLNKMKTLEKHKEVKQMQQITRQWGTNIFKEGEKLSKPDGVLQIQILDIPQCRMLGHNQETSQCCYEKCNRKFALKNFLQRIKRQKWVNVKDVNKQQDMGCKDQNKTIFMSKYLAEVADAEVLVLPQTETSCIMFSLSIPASLLHQ